MYQSFFASPVGVIRICASEQGITKVFFVDEERDVLESEITQSCKQQLQEFFSGQRQQFTLPLDQQGTAFQRNVWSALMKIPYGETASYYDIATMINNPKAVRAVGAANGKNPIGIIVPCHRVIGRNGTLTGYAGGMDRKAWLLQHENPQFVSTDQTMNAAKHCQISLFN